MKANQAYVVGMYASFPAVPGITTRPFLLQFDFVSS